MIQDELWLKIGTEVERTSWEKSEEKEMHDSLEGYFTEKRLKHNFCSEKDKCSKWMEVTKGRIS